jgi:hypothetical protein
MRAKLVGEPLYESSRPDGLYTRNDIVKIMYGGLASQPGAIEYMQKQVAKWSEEEFMDYIKEKNKFRLERIRKNLYQIK